MNFTNAPMNWQNKGIEPPDTLKSSGFTAGYRPPAAYHNAMFANAFDCISELQTKLSTVNESKQDATFNSNGFTTIDEITDVLQNCKETETITDIDSFYPINDGVKIGVYITDDAIDFGTYYVIALRYDNVLRQIVFSCDSNRIKQRTKTDEQTTWRAWTNPAISVSSQNTYTLSSYNASVNYTFSSYTTHADVKIISCLNGETATCVGTMCDIANNKIWFFKPQGISSAVTLNITYQVIEF